MAVLADATGGARYLEVEDSGRGERKTLRAARCILLNLKCAKFANLTAPLALVTIGGALKEHLREDVKVDYFDEQVRPLSALREVLCSGHYDVIGISAQVGAAQSMWRVLEMTSELNFPGAIIVGNVTATYAADEILQRYPSVLACVGRGEEAMVRLVGAILAGDDPHGAAIPNIRRVRGNEIEATESRALTAAFENHADWPGFFAHYAPGSYREYWVESSRGCPQKRNNVGCTYCAIVPDAGSRDWAPRSIETVSADVSNLVRYGVRHVRFADEEFMANQPLRALEFAREIAPSLKADSGDRCTFDVAMRVDDIHRPNRSHDRLVLQVEGELELTSSNRLRRLALRSLKSAGLRQVYLGVESGSGAQLRRMRKGATVASNEVAIEALRELGVRAACGWIMFDPLMEDPMELRLNADFIRRNRLLPQSLDQDFVTDPINTMRVLEGAPLVDQLRASGLLGAKHDNLIEYRFSYRSPQISSIVESLQDWQSRFGGVELYSLRAEISARSLDRASDDDLSHSFFELKTLNLAACEALAEIALQDGSRRQLSAADVPSFLGHRRIALTALVERAGA